MLDKYTKDFCYSNYYYYEQHFTGYILNEYDL